MVRYNIVNMYIRGSNVSPQTSHALNEMWKNYAFSDHVLYHKSLFTSWVKGDSVEVDLQGGNHKSLEELFQWISKSGLMFPHSKFNESSDALNGACTVVSVIPDNVALRLIKAYRSNSDVDFKERKILENVDMVIRGNYIKFAKTIAGLRTVK